MHSAHGKSNTECQVVEQSTYGNLRFLVPRGCEYQLPLRNAILNTMQRLGHSQLYTTPIESAKNPSTFLCGVCNRGGHVSMMFSPSSNPNFVFIAHGRIFHTSCVENQAEDAFYKLRES